MPGELSGTGAVIALEAALGRTAASTRATYLALLTAAPADNTTPATMTEYGATGYSRQAVTWGAATGDPATSSNTNSISFGPLTGANGSTPITHAALVSSASGTTGDLVAHWQLTSSRTPAAGDSINVAIGALTLSLD